MRNKDLWKHDLENTAQQAYERRKQCNTESYHREYVAKALAHVNKRLFIGRVITMNVLLSLMLLFSIASILITKQLPHIGFIVWVSGIIIFAALKGIIDTKWMYFRVMGNCIKWLVREVEDPRSVDALIKIMGEQRDKWDIKVVVGEHLLFWALGGYYVMSNTQRTALRNTTR